MRTRFALLALVVAACESTTGGGGGGTKVAESGTAKGSAGGFSAQMSVELEKAGVGGPAIPPVSPPPSPAAANGGGSASATGSATGPAAPATGSAAPATGSAAPAAAAGSAASAGSAAAAGSASADKPVTGAAPATSDKPAAAGKDMTAVGAVKAPANRAYVKPAAEIAAIKLELEPNWERDMGEAGTFSLVVKIPSTDDTRVFSVRYGFEEDTAPLDCDQYRKFLEDRGSMKVSLNRQKGAGCYVEGTDKGGTAAFRLIMIYGGKRLMCHGSLYKDGASASLGDLRDKVLMQAKKICETLTL